MDKEINIPFDELTTGLVIFCYGTSGFYTVIRRKSIVLLIHSNSNIFYTFGESNYKTVLKDLDVKEIRQYELPIINLLNFDVEDLSKYSYIRILLRVPRNEIGEFMLFGKKDLKSGMLVEFEDGDLGVVINDFIATKVQKINLNNRSIEENLTSVFMNCTINKVFKPTYALPLNLILNKDYYQVIFDREKMENQIPPKYLVIKD